MTNVAEFLIGAKKLIEDPAKWTKGWFARTSFNGMVGSLDERATCFCSLGALERYDGHELPINKYNPLTGDPHISRFAQDALQEVMGCAVEDFNDEHSHEEVMQKWDEAINLAKAQEAK